MIDNSYKAFLKKTKPTKFRRAKQALALCTEYISNINIKYTIYNILSNIGFVVKIHRDEVVQKYRRTLEEECSAQKDNIFFRAKVTTYEEEHINVLYFMCKRKILYEVDNSFTEQVYESAPSDIYFRLTSSEPFRRIDNGNEYKVFRYTPMMVSSEYDENSEVKTLDYRLDFTSLKNRHIKRVFSEYEKEYLDSSTMDTLAFNQFDREWQDFLDRDFKLSEVLKKEI